jgi:hypothetical protein
MYVLVAVMEGSSERSEFSSSSEAYKRFCDLRLSSRYTIITLTGQHGVMFEYQGKCRITQAILGA